MKQERNRRKMGGKKIGLYKFYNFFFFKLRHTQKKIQTKYADFFTRYSKKHAKNVVIHEIKRRKVIIFRKS